MPQLSARGRWHRKAATSTPQGRVDGKGVSRYRCNLPPQAYWALKQNLQYEQFLAGAENNHYEVLSCSEDTDEHGQVICKRSTRVTAIDNPFPPSLRSWLGVVDGFSFEINETWWRDLFDADHPLTFSTKPPVYADRVFVGGSSWCEPRSASSCVLCFTFNVNVNIPAIGGFISKGIEAGSKKAYAALPSRAEVFYKKLHSPQASPKASSRLPKMPSPSPQQRKAKSPSPHKATPGTPGTGDGGQEGVAAASSVQRALFQPSALQQRVTQAQARIRWGRVHARKKRGELLAMVASALREVSKEEGYLAAPGPWDFLCCKRGGAPPRPEGSTHGSTHGRAQHAAAGDPPSVLCTPTRSPRIAPVQV